MLWLVCACAVCSSPRGMCAHPFSSHAPGSSASLARRLSHFRVFAFSFPTPPALGVWLTNARSSGFARLAKRFAFPGRLSSFAALPNEGATKRLRRLEWLAISNGVRALILPVLNLAQLTSARIAVAIPGDLRLGLLTNLFDDRRL